MRIFAGLYLLLASSASGQSTTEASTIVHEDGGYCGVQSADFVTYSFMGNYRVAGQNGCELGESQDECLCAPDFSDNQPLSGWKWQCGDTVKFGPIPGKMCPAEVPYEAPSATAQALGVPANIPCDVASHPTGYPEDPVCGYSTCDEGGSTSAVCACVDLSERGLGDGPQWFCLHSTCDCNDEEKETVAASGGVTMGATAVLAASAAAALF